MTIIEDIRANQIVDLHLKDVPAEYFGDTIDMIAALYDDTSIESYKQQLIKMKEDLKNRQAFYLAEAHARVVYQKTLARIVAQVQEKSRDAQLVEDVVIWALECEAEAKSERAALENAGNKVPPGGSFAAPVEKKSKAASGSDSDSDSD